MVFCCWKHQGITGEYRTCSTQKGDSKHALNARMFDVHVHEIVVHQSCWSELKFRSGCCWSACLYLSERPLPLTRPPTSPEFVAADSVGYEQVHEPGVGLDEPHGVPHEPPAGVFPQQRQACRGRQHHGPAAHEVARNGEWPRGRDAQSQRQLHILTHVRMLAIDHDQRWCTWW